MKKSLVILTCVISLLGFTTQTLACMGSSYSRTYAAQYDIPSTYDLAISKLPIHSNAYYQWIIQASLEKIKNNQMTLNDYDDLAVAYNKIGDKAKAIELLTPLVKKNPNRFSSVSNLGSIYLNLGDYENGLKYIRIANTLKPVDSYDREYAQEKVYSYLKSRHKTIPYSFPIQNIESGTNFADFALKDVPIEKQNDEIIRLIFGVENMVRFGNHDSPVSMEVLGDLYLRFQNINNLTSYRQDQLKENINDFYVAAFVKSQIKNEKDLEYLNIKNNLNINYYNNRTEYIEKEFKKVKEERLELETKEKEIISKNQSNNEIEKILNDELISKGSNNIKMSVMNEKERLYKILKTKNNEIEANEYLNYTSLVNLLAWIMLIISSVGTITLIWNRQKKLKKYPELKNEEFKCLNSLISKMNKTLTTTVLLGGFSLIVINTVTKNIDVINIILVLAIIVFFLTSIVLALVNIYLIGFKKYQNNDNEHLSSRKKMRKAVLLGVIAIGLFMAVSLTESYIYNKYEYKTQSSFFNTFSKSTALRTVN